ncbi:helix-turn-helix domain-containing protein [Acutalibacter sp.]|jgi:DNA-binding Xre family transcriptional regulator|uniref:helix-turn-helix domain-containing protein n=1 Tax=Acutalibacter sp. TaxID=1918636 RepID=UPI0021700FEE|nr:helix-turn-helix transcriptional regulator [Acutalibacter sp.]
MNIIPMRIEIMLAKKRMTKATLAEKSGVSRQNISTIVRRGTCSPITAGKLAAALGVEVVDLTERKEN